MKLPKLPNRIRRYQPQVVQFGGLNLTAGAKDGEFKATSGISTMDYPTLTQMPERIVLSDYDDPSDIYYWNGSLYVCDGDDLKKGGTVIGTLDDDNSGSRNFAVVNTKLVIWPDKVYVDLNDNTVNSLINKNEEYSTYTVTDSTITASGIDADFAVGDVLDVIGTGVKGKHIIVESTSTDSITFAAGSINLNNPSGTLSVMSSVPDLDYICASGNRLWGCSNDDHTVYASALGDPSTFYDYTSDLGAFSTAIGSEGIFTAICEYNDTVLVWKEEKLYKILGSYPSEYYMTESTIPGVQGGDHKSIVVINGLLYYCGKYGIYVYNGNRPQIVSQDLGIGSYIYGGERITGFTDVCCASDGRLLYVGCIANAAGGDNAVEWPVGPQLFAYDILHGLWINELDLPENIMSMAQDGRNVFMLHWGNAAGRKNYITQTGETISTQQPWYAEYSEVTENTFNRKGYTKILIRIRQAIGSTFRVLAKEDDRAYREVWSDSYPTDQTFVLDEVVTVPPSLDSPTIPVIPDYDTILQEGRIFAEIKGERAYTVEYDTTDKTLYARTLNWQMYVDFQHAEIDIATDSTTVLSGDYYVRIFTETGSGPKKSKMQTIPIRLGRCDKYQIRLEGTGETAVLGMAREFVSGSDIN